MNEQITLALGEALTVPRDGQYDYPAIRAHIADAVTYICRGWDQTHEGWRDAALNELAERIAVYLTGHRHRDRPGRPCHVRAASRRGDLTCLAATAAAAAPHQS